MRFIINYSLILLLFGFVNNSKEIDKTVETQEYDVVIYGGTPAGIAAAIQVARLKKSVALIEPTSHLGGIIVNGLGVTDIDNHGEFQNSLAVGGIALEFYRKIAEYYGRLDEFNSKLNSGIKDASIWRYEPHVAENIIMNWLKEYPIDIFFLTRLKEGNKSVKKNGAVIQEIVMENELEFSAKMFIDATLEGDLLVNSGVTTTWGRESNSLYNETKNGIRPKTVYGQFSVDVDPYNIPGNPLSGLIPTIQNDAFGTPGEGDKTIQAYCFRVCLTFDSLNLIPFPRPKEYDRNQYEIYLRYLKAGGKLSVPGDILPNKKTDYNGGHALSHNLYGMNRKYPDGSYSDRKRIFDQHKTFTQGLFYFLANDTEVAKLDSFLQNSWKKWGLCKDEFIDNNGWPYQFYIRDARRMVSDYVITEHHTKRINPTLAEDPVAIAYWPPDLHSTRRIVKDGHAYNEGFVFGGNDWRPFGISYRALIPRKEECINLLTPTCPSSSHVAYGAIRIEFTFMALGQATALAACQAINDDCAVQKVRYEKLKLLLQNVGQIIDPYLVGMPNF